MSKPNTSPFPADAKIKVLVKSNPFREGSNSAKVFDTYKPGMTVAQFATAVAKGPWKSTPPMFLRVHLDKGLIAIDGVKAATPRPVNDKPVERAAKPVKEQKEPRPLVIVDKVAIANGELTRGATVKFSAIGRFTGTVLQVGQQQSEVRWHTGENSYFTKWESNHTLYIVKPGAEAATPQIVGTGKSKGGKLSSTRTTLPTADEVAGMAIPPFLQRTVGSTAPADVKPVDAAPKKRSKSKAKVKAKVKEAA